MNQKQMKTKTQVANQEEVAETRKKKKWKPKD